MGRVDDAEARFEPRRQALVTERPGGRSPAAAGMFASAPQRWDWMSRSDGFVSAVPSGSTTVGTV